MSEHTDWAARGLPTDGQDRIEMAFGIIRGMGGLVELFPFREAAAELRGRVDAAFYVDPTAAKDYLAGEGSVDVQLRLLDAAADFADAMELARREVEGDVAAAVPLRLSRTRGTWTTTQRARHGTAPEVPAAASARGCRRRPAARSSPTPRSCSSRSRCRAAFTLCELTKLGDAIFVYPGTNLRPPSLGGRT